MFDDIFNFTGLGLSPELDQPLDANLDGSPELTLEREPLNPANSHNIFPQPALAETLGHPLGLLPAMLSEHLQGEFDLPELAGRCLETWGEPLDDASHWRLQAGANSCAVVAQASIYEAITGNLMSEAQACQIAEQQGWFDPEIGTRPDQLGAFLNGLGIETHSQYDGTLEDIAQALAQGQKVLVGLDPNEVWNPLRNPLTDQPLEQPDGGHAVWVTGLTTMPDGSVQVMVNDSGISHGRMCSIDAKDFLNAWDDFGNHLIVAEASPKMQTPQFA